VVGRLRNNRHSLGQHSCVCGIPFSPAVADKKPRLDPGGFSEYGVFWLPASVGLEIQNQREVLGLVSVPLRRALRHLRSRVWAWCTLLDFCLGDERDR